MTLKRMSFLVFFMALFSILVLTQNQTKKSFVLQDGGQSIQNDLSCVPCSPR